MRRGKILLREFRESDADRLVYLANNINIAKNLRDGFPHPYYRKDAEKFIDMCMILDPPSVFAIEYTGEHIGNIGLTFGSDVYRKSAEIGYFVAEPYWNKGIATEAVKLMTEIAFDHFGMVRVHAGIFEYNHASMRVLEKCGYRKEGVFRKSVIKMNALWDEVRYAKINPGVA